MPLIPEQSVPLIPEQTMPLFFAEKSKGSSIFWFSVRTTHLTFRHKVSQ
jgi:hypothetical protein